MAIGKPPSHWCVLSPAAWQPDRSHAAARPDWHCAQSYDDAELLLAAVLELAPDYRVARQEYAGVLIELHRHEQARRELDRLLTDEPDSRQLKMLYAASSVGLGQHDAPSHSTGRCSWEAEDAEVHLSIAHATEDSRQSEEAIDSYRTAAACRPDFGDAYWSLANLKTYRFTNEELTRIHAGLPRRTTAAVDRYHLLFATR